MIDRKSDALEVRDPKTGNGRSLRRRGGRNEAGEVRCEGGASFGEAS